MRSPLSLKWPSHGESIYFPFLLSILCIYSYVAYGATTALEASDALLVPTEFVAVTVKVYEVVGVSPLTVAKVPLVVAVMPPGLEVTV